MTREKGGRCIGNDVLALSACVITSLLSGCVTLNVMRDLGERTDRVSGYDRAVRRDDEIIVSYHVDTRAGSRTVAADAPRWSSLDLGKLDWHVLERGPQPITQCLLVMQAGTRPQTTVPPHEEIPLFPESLGKDVRKEEGVRYLRSEAESHRLSLHVQPGGRLTLVVHEREGSPSLIYADICPPFRRYRTGWAVPARIAVLPLTLTADVATSPAQLFLLICFMLFPPRIV